MFRLEYLESRLILAFDKCGGKNQSFATTITHPIHYEDPELERQVGFMTDKWAAMHWKEIPVRYMDWFLMSCDGTEGEYRFPLNTAKSVLCLTAANKANKKWDV